MFWPSELRLERCEAGSGGGGVPPAGGGAKAPARVLCAWEGGGGGAKTGISASILCFSTHCTTTRGCGCVSSSSSRPAELRRKSRQGVGVL